MSLTQLTERARVPRAQVFRAHPPHPLSFSAAVLRISSRHPGGLLARVSRPAGSVQVSCSGRPHRECQFSCGNLGLRLSTAASFATGRKTRLVPRLGARVDDGCMVCCTDPCHFLVQEGLFGNFHCRIQLQALAGTCRHLQADCHWTSQSSIRLLCVAGCCRQSEMTGILTGVAGSPK